MTMDFDVALTCSDNCVSLLCSQTTFILEDNLDMRLEVGAGSDSQELLIKDTISTQRGNLDGHSFCGERSYALTNNQPWLTLVGSTLTITSNSVDDTQEEIESQIIVSLALDDSVYTVINFKATLYSDDPAIATTAVCNSVTLQRPDRLEDMQIAYGSGSRVT